MLASTQSKASPELQNGFNLPSKAEVSKSQPKPKPHAYFNKGVIDSRKPKPKRAQLTRSQRARARLKTKLKLVSLANELNDHKLAAKLKRCSSMRNFLTCGDHEYKKKVSLRCQFRLCPYCAERRSRELFRRFLPIVLAFLKTHRVEPVHLILTQPQKENETAKQSRARLMKSFGKLVRADKKNSFWRDHFKGGIWSLEPKLAKRKDKDGVYHTHLHVLAFRSKFFNIKPGDNELGDLWRIVGGGENFYLRPITDIESGLKEVLKYIAKPLDIDRFTAETLSQFIEMKGAHFVEAFGEFRTFAGKFELVEEETDDADADADDDAIERTKYAELEEGSPCPCCSNPLFEVHFTEEQHIAYLESIEVRKKPT